MMKLYKLIRDNTDINRPMTQARLRKLPGADDIMGYKATFARRLYELADALNTDGDGKVLPKEQWEIVFDGYEQKRVKGDETARIGKIYYNHDLISKRYEKPREEKTYVKDYPIPKERKEHITNESLRIEGMLETINKAIKMNSMVKFDILHIDKDGTRRGQNARAGLTEYIVSPYEIIHYDGKYWLISNCQRTWTGKATYVFSSGTNIYRLDRMNYVDFAKDKRGRKPTRKPYLVKIIPDEKYELRGEMIGTDLFQETTCKFQISWKNVPKRERGNYAFVEEMFPGSWSVDKCVMTVSGPLYRVLFFKQYYGKFISGLTECIADKTE